MKCYVHGSIDKPAVAVIGVWDPLLPAHKRLFEDIRARARAQSLTALVIAIDPDPVRFLWGASSRPVYNDVHTRIGQIIHCGIDELFRLIFVLG
jgi:FAD synthase